MDHPEAGALFLKLAGISDVLVENFSPRVLPNWGLGYDVLKQVNANLIMISMSAMGQSGPWKDLVAFGPTLQSLGGLTYLTSFSEHAPLGVGFAYADIIAGLYGALAVLAALEYRDRTGQGQYIDLSQYEAVCNTIGPALLDVLTNKKVLLPQGNYSEDIPAAPYNCYRCPGEDRWCVITVFTEDEWRALCEIMGNPAWTAEKRFATLSKRKAHKKELDEYIQNWTIRHTAEEIVALLQKSGVPAEVVRDAGDLAGDPHLMSRGFFRKLSHPVLGETMTDTLPIRFEGQGQDPWEPSPLLGEDNHYVYGELLGLSEAEIKTHMEKGVIA
jgi:crotonobetainyl-CoA:carnitine CoA-transferase CaiB-like acyl-CoA transferase